MAKKQPKAKKAPAPKRKAAPRKAAARTPAPSVAAAAASAAAELAAGATVNYVREPGKIEPVKVVAIDGKVATIEFPNGRRLEGVQRGSGEAGTWSPL